MLSDQVRAKLAVPWILFPAVVMLDITEMDHSVQSVLSDRSARMVSLQIIDVIQSSLFDFSLATSDPSHQKIDKLNP
jgi:hypothetical protein